MLVSTARWTRLAFPNEIFGDNWLAYNLRTKRRLLISDVDAYCLVRAVTPLHDTDLQELLCDAFSMETQFAQLIVSDLIETNLLVEYSKMGSVDCTLTQMRDNWRKAGWAEAFEYFLFAYDMQFNPGDPTGRRAAAQLMRTYSQQRPDVDRVRTFSTIESVPLDAMKRDSLVLSLLGLAGSTVQRRKPEWGGEDLLFRPPPSGGARHPIDTFVFLPAADGDVRSGIHYLNFQTNSLDRIDRSGPVQLGALFPALSERVKFFPVGGLCFIADVKRNMYRYREPRTYRTVFLDAGHLISCIEHAANVFGIRTHVHYGGDIDLINDATLSNDVEHVFIASMFFG